VIKIEHLIDKPLVRYDDYKTSGPACVYLIKFGFSLGFLSFFLIRKLPEP
jgi:hypothetical protein